MYDLCYGKYPNLLCLILKYLLVLQINEDTFKSKVIYNWEDSLMKSSTTKAIPPQTTSRHE